MADGISFDPLGAFMAGRQARFEDTKRKNALAQMQREDQARPLIGNALMGDGNSLNALAGIDPQSYMDINKFNQQKSTAAQESDAARLDRISGVLFRADTPEKWNQAITYLESSGVQVDPHERDFANRDAVLGEAMSMKEQMAQMTAQQNADTSRINAEKKPEGGAGFSLGEGETRYDANGNVIARGPPKKVQPRALTSVDKNAILEADDQIQTATNTIDMLNRALELNDKAGSGALAGAQSFAARNDPTGFFDDDKGAATTDFNNIVMGQALSGMKALFGGNPTEGERAVLLQLQGMADKTPAERASIINRGIELAARRKNFNKERIDELRGGSYFGGASTVETNESGGPPAPAASGGNFVNDFSQIPEGRKFRDKQSGKVYIMKNGKPVEVK